MIEVLAQRQQPLKEARGRGREGYMANMAVLSGLKGAQPS
jgi:hypothetical protein